MQTKTQTTRSCPNEKKNILRKIVTPDPEPGARGRVDKVRTGEARLSGRPRRRCRGGARPPRGPQPPDGSPMLSAFSASRTTPAAHAVARSCFRSRALTGQLRCPLRRRPPALKPLVPGHTAVQRAVADQTQQRETKAKSHASPRRRNRRPTPHGSDASASE
jgi:hypothetical protein